MAQSALRVVESTSMDKSKALDAALSQIERNFGKGSIMRLGKSDKNLDVDTVSTGSLGLDIALGIGGLPRGRIVEIYGPESSGKTTLALHVIAEAQRAGGTCASPILMIEPLPNCFSIWAKAAASALLLLSSIAFIPLDLPKLVLLIAAPLEGVR